MSYFDRMMNRAVRKAVNEALKPVKAEFKGKMGEALTSFAIDLSELCSIKGKQLNDLYIPVGKDKTSEIDIVYITERGIFVIENKSYTGVIEGDISQSEWIVTSASGKKYGLYNPVMQNRRHISALAGLLSVNEPSLFARNIPLFSVIVFSDTALLHISSRAPSDTVIVNRSRLAGRLTELREHADTVLCENEVNELYEKLKLFEKPDKSVTEAHKEQVRRSAGAAAQKTGELCPKCGKELVVRTVRNGPGAGRKFIGCSGFPNCRYTKDM